MRQVVHLFVVLLSLCVLSSGYAAEQCPRKSVFVQLSNSGAKYDVVFARRNLISRMFLCHSDGAHSVAYVIDYVGDPYMVSRYDHLDGKDYLLLVAGTASGFVGHVLEVTKSGVKEIVSSGGVGLPDVGVNKDGALSLHFVRHDDEVTYILGVGDHVETISKPVDWRAMHGIPPEGTQ